MFQNYTPFDFNFTYSEIEPNEPLNPRTQPLQTATDVLSYCGIVINVIVITLLVLGLIRSSEQRRLPRVWLLLGVLVANLLTLIFGLLPRHLQEWDAVTSSHVLCVLILHLSTCFDTVSVLVSALLTCQIFLWVYVPTAEKGRRTLLFWATSEVAVLIVSIAVVLAMFAPETEILTFDSLTQAKKACIAIGREITNAVFSILFFLLPLVHVLPVGLLSLWLNAGNRRQNAVELVPLPVTSQSNPEYFGVDPVKPDKGVQDITQQDKMTGERRASILLPWVIFNILNIFLGFGLRIPGHLIAQEFFRAGTFYKTDNFDEEINFWYASVLCRVIYFSFVPLMCLLLPEIRMTLMIIYRMFKK